MAETEEPPISEDTSEMIENQVKKGKARKFFLIYKGSSIKTLVVFKKGPFGPKVMKAKKDGFKGDVCYGVVTGSGKNLLFQLPGNGEVAAAMKVDSFEEKPPTKTAKLREFLRDNGLEFKPDYQVITEVERAVDPECEVDNDVSKSVVDEKLPSDEKSATTVATQLGNAVKRLKPVMDQLIASDSSLKGELTKTLTTIVGEIKNQSFDQARINIAQFTERMKDLRGKSSEDTKGDLASLYRERSGLIEPRINSIQKVNPKNATALVNVWVFAQSQAGGGNFQRAIEALDRLEPKLDEALRTAPTTDTERFGIEEGIVEVTREKLIEAFKKTKLVWERTRGGVQGELQKLEKAILELSNGEDDYEYIKANSSNVYVALDDLDEELIEVLDEAANATDDRVRDQLHRDARAIVRRYQEFLANDEFLREVDGNPFVAIKVRTTLDASLNAIDKSLAISTAG